MSTDTPIVEMFGNVVTAAESAILPYLKTINPKIVQLHYEHGHPQEIVGTLAEMSQTQAFQAKKYPLVALFQDFPEPVSGKPGELAKARVTVVITTQTQPGLKAAERYAVNFKSILYPIYKELMWQLANSAYFFHSTVPRHDKIDRPFWGKEGLYGNIASVATDELDCIELRNLELTIPPAACHRTKAFF